MVALRGHFFKKFAWRPGFEGFRHRKMPFSQWKLPILKGLREIGNGWGEEERERTETGIRNRPPFQTRPGKNTPFGHAPHSDNDN